MHHERSTSEQIRRAIQRAIVRYLARCGGTFHANAYGPAGRYVVLLDETQYHRLNSPDAGFDAYWFLRPQVRQFAAAMERTLRANDHQTGGTQTSPFWLIDQLYDNADDLYDALCSLVQDPNAPNHVLAKSAGVANFAMLLADVLGAIPLSPSPSQGVHSSLPLSPSPSQGDHGPRSEAEWGGGQGVGGVPS